MSDCSASLHPYESMWQYKRIESSTYDGTILRGNLYHSTKTSGPSPIGIFCHGLGLLKEQYLENWFNHVLTSGYYVLTYDHRFFGDSEGLPREQFDWLGQAEDFFDAVTFVRLHSKVDENKELAGVLPMPVD
ncbi:hypothetical protein LTR84_007184 [Exophiala bonariae]|uniref:Serine aminopeptidase S33 domain-containing protein n=1 Tax=Exophiala bonariae TaxID=1690606 RepID=A0AAV9MYQ4_9EURO|nr:hypothetical protein LTR84_007184 [Exophiala bonariae]